MILFGRSERKSGGSRARDVEFAEAICRRHDLDLNIREVSPSIQRPLHRKLDGVSATPLEPPLSLLSSASLLPGQ